MKILFISCSSIGDAVITTGLLAYLFKMHPQADFTIAVGPTPAPLFKAFPQLERLIVIHKQPWKKHWIHLWKEVRPIHWDLVVDLRGSLLSFLLHAKKRKIFHSMNKSKSKIDQLGALFNLYPSPLPSLWVSKESVDKAQGMLPKIPVIVLIPKSNSIIKDWPIERFAELGCRLLKIPSFAGASIVILGLEHQRSLLLPLINALPASQTLDLIGKTDISLACAILQQSQLVIGNDSGLLQIAGALKIRLIGLYGPTNDIKYAPRGENVRIAKVRKFTPWEEEKHDPAIIRNLTVDHVEATVRELLNAS